MLSTVFWSINFLGIVWTSIEVIKALSYRVGSADPFDGVVFLGAVITLFCVPTTGALSI